MEYTKILVVDDEPDLCSIFKFNLESNGYEVDVSYSAEDALKKDLTGYSLILLDVMMSKISGFEMLSILRNERNINTPVIFITAMNTEQNMIKGFNLGAEDYIKKPFSINEVLVRVNAVISRYKKSINREVNNNGLNLDSLHKQVLINNDTIDLTRKEYEIFNLLFLQPGKVYSRSDILKQIWPDQEYVTGRTVDVNITRIRNKLGVWSKCITTRSGFGYCFDEKIIAKSIK